MWVQSLDLEDALEKETSTHSSILARKISWTEGPGGLQPMGLQRVGHNLVTKEQFLVTCRLFFKNRYLFLTSVKSNHWEGGVSSISRDVG